MSRRHFTNTRLVTTMRCWDDCRDDICILLRVAYNNEQSEQFCQCAIPPDDHDFEISRLTVWMIDLVGLRCRLSALQQYGLYDILVNDDLKSTQSDLAGKSLHDMFVVCYGWYSLTCRYVSTFYSERAVLKPNHAGSARLGVGRWWCGESSQRRNDMKSSKIHQTQQ